MADNGWFWQKDAGPDGTGAMVPPETSVKASADSIEVKAAPAEVTGPVAIETDYKDWTTNTRLGQDMSPSDINYKMGKPLKWDADTKSWQGDAAGAKKLAARLMAEAENLRSWASGKQSVNATERLAHANRLIRVANQIERELKNPSARAPQASVSSSRPLSLGEKMRAYQAERLAKAKAGNS